MECPGRATPGHPAERPARENGIKTTAFPERHHSSPYRRWRHIEGNGPDFTKFHLNFSFLPVWAFVLTNAVANYLRNKPPCEGNSLSYFKFDSETLKDSGLRKILSPSTFPRVTLPISSITPSLILVISGRIRTGLLSNFVNIQPEESYERRGRTGENQKTREF